MPKQVLSEIRYNLVSIKKYIFSFCFFLLCIYPASYVHADAVYRTGVENMFPIAAELSDGKIISIYNNSNEKFGELGYWFNAAIYDPEMDEVCTYGLESQVDCIFTTNTQIWNNFIKVYPGSDNTFILCIPVREGYYLELYDENGNHLDGESILTGGTIMDGNTWNSDIHKLVFGKNGQIFANVMITKNIVTNGNSTTGDYQGYQCYRIDYDTDIEVTHMEVSDRLYYSNYIPLYDGSVLAIGFNVNKCYRSYGDSFENVTISDDLHNIFNNTLSNIGVRNQVIFNSDSTEIIFLWKKSLQSITFDSEIRLIDRHYVVDKIYDQWDIDGISCFEISKTDSGYKFMCGYILGSGGPTNSMCGLINEYGDITESYECIGGIVDRGVAFRRSSDDYIAVWTSSFSRVIPTKTDIHEWDEGVVSKAPTFIESGEYIYTCKQCGESKTVTIPIPFPEENSLSYAKIDIEDGAWIDTGKNVSSYIHVILSGKLLKEGEDYIIRALEYTPGDDSMNYAIDAIGDYYCGIVENGRYNISNPHIHKWDEGYVEYDGSKVIEIYTCTECGKMDSHTIKEYINLDCAYVDYHCDGHEFVYCGEEIRPVIDVYYKGNLLVCGHDYEITYADNINAGQAKAKITGIGDCIGERTIEYEIHKADSPPGISSYTMTVDYKMEYVRDVELPAGWTFLYPNQRLDVGSNYGIPIEYNGDDKDNYKDLAVGLEIVREVNADNTTEATSEGGKTEKTTEIAPSEEPKTEKTTEIAPSEELKTEKTTEIAPREEPKTEKTTEIAPSEEPKTEKTTEVASSEEPKTEKTTENNTKSINNEIIYKNNVYRLSGKKAVFVRPVNSNVKSLTIPNKIKIKNKKYTVSAIEGNACYGMKKLQTVIVGDGVITVGEKAFANCEKLKKITFGNNLVKLSNKVLAGDGILKRITFKSRKIKSFGKKTFEGVPRKVDIIIPRAKMKKYVKLIKKAK